MTPQEKRDHLELAVLFKSEGQFPAREAIGRAFEQMLAGYITEWLSPDVGTDQAERLRHKCGGVIDALTSMGLNADRVVEETVKRQVKESLKTTD